MVQSQFCLSWESYKSSVCCGFSSLQQKGELVDMTLAADGHLVRVHKVLMAMSSPFIKDLILSAEGNHPVLFLNNVPYKTLGLLLEYIYTGEVLVPADHLSTFIASAKALHIRGLENIDMSNNMLRMSRSELEDNSMAHVSGVKKVTLPTGDGIEQVDIPAAARNIFVKSSNSNTTQKPSTSFDLDSKDNLQDFVIDDSGAQDSDDDFNTSADPPQVSDKTNSSVKKLSSNLQFTVSIRGSLQVILNRYIYNFHSSSQGKGIRRWRCVDYRNHKCQAFIVTKGNIVLNRANLHNHPFHDKKIMDKIEKKVVFSALDEVKGYKEKESNVSSDNSLDNDDFGHLVEARSQRKSRSMMDL